MKKEIIVSVDGNEIAQSAVQYIQNDQAEDKEALDVSVEPKKCTGIVMNCFRLNVREKPSTESEVIHILNRKERVTVDLEETHSDWTKVYFQDGVEGYCMIDYIAIE